MDALAAETFQANNPDFLKQEANKEKARLKRLELAKVREETKRQKTSEAGASASTSKAQRKRKQKVAPPESEPDTDDEFLAPVKKFKAPTLYSSDESDSSDSDA